MTWDKQDPDKFKNAVVKYELFFLTDHNGSGSTGPVAGEEEDKKFFAQGWDNSLFCVEIPVADGSPTQIVDMNNPIGWERIWGFAVYSNGEWRPTPVRVAAKSYEGEVTEADYAKSAIVLPEGYSFKK